MSPSPQIRISEHIFMCGVPTPKNFEDINFDVINFDEIYFEEFNFDKIIFEEINFDY